jgi:hypothetical protein
MVAGKLHLHPLVAPTRCLEIHIPTYLSVAEPDQTIISKTGCRSVHLQEGVLIEVEHAWFACMIACSDA